MESDDYSLEHQLTLDEENRALPIRNADSSFAYKYHREWVSIKDTYTFQGQFVLVMRLLRKYGWTVEPPELEAITSNTHLLADTLEFNRQLIDENRRLRAALTANEGKPTPESDKVFWYWFTSENNTYWREFFPSGKLEKSYNGNIWLYPNPADPHNLKELRTLFIPRLIKETDLPK